MYDALYDQGIAWGGANIKTDTVTFRFRDELFEFPTIQAIDVAKFNGYFYTARIEDLRALEAKAASG